MGLYPTEVLRQVHTPEPWRTHKESGFSLRVKGSAVGFYAGKWHDLWLLRRTLVALEKGAIKKTKEEKLRAMKLIQQAR